MSRAKVGKMKNNQDLPPFCAIEGIEPLEPIPSLCEPLLSDAKLLYEASKLIAKTIAQKRAFTPKEKRAIAYTLKNYSNDVYTQNDFKDL